MNNYIFQKYIEAFILAGADDKILKDLFGLNKKEIKKFENDYIKRSAPKMKRLAMAHNEPDEEMRRLKIYGVLLGVDYLLWQIGEKELPLEKEMEYKAFISGKAQYDALRIKAKTLVDNKQSSLLDELKKITIVTKKADEFDELKNG